MSQPHKPSMSSINTASINANYYQMETAIHDLGRERFDQSTAEVGDRDAALFASQPVSVRKGRAPRGLEAQVFAWNTMKYTTEDRDNLAEMKVSTPDC